MDTTETITKQQLVSKLVNDSVALVERQPERPVETVNVAIYRMVRETRESNAVAVFEKNVKLIRKHEPLIDGRFSASRIDETTFKRAASDEELLGLTPAKELIEAAVLFVNMNDIPGNKLLDVSYTLQRLLAIQRGCQYDAVFGGSSYTTE